MRQVQLRNDNELFQFEPCSNNLFPKRSQIVLVGAPDFLNKSVQAEALELPRDLWRGFIRQMAAEIFILKAGDVVFTPGNGFKKQLIVLIKEIESGKRTIIVFGGTRKFVEFIIARTGIIDSRNEFEISTISSGKKFSQCGKTVNGLLHGSPFSFAASVAMFYLTVVFKKGDVIDGGFDAKDERELVIHLDGNRSHGVFDTSAFDANVETVSHFVLIVAVEFAAEKSGDVVGFDGVDRGSCQIIVNGSQVGLFFKDYVCGIFGLINAPMIGDSKMLMDGTKAAGKFVEFPVKLSSLSAVGNFLCAFPIADFGKGVVEQFVGDSFTLQLQGQPIMAVTVNLQATGQPRWYSDVTKPQFFIDEIKVEMQALALIGFQKGLAAIFVMPWLECRTLFHGREDPYQSGMIAAFGQYFLDPVFFAEVLLTNKLNFNPMIGGQFFRILSQLIPEGLSEPWVVENTDFACIKPGSHAFGKANMRQGSKDENTIVAG